MMRIKKEKTYSTFTMAQNKNLQLYNKRANIEK